MKKFKFDQSWNFLSNKVNIKLYIYDIGMKLPKLAKVGFSKLNLCEFVIIPTYCNVKKQYYILMLMI